MRENFFPYSAMKVKIHRDHFVTGLQQVLNIVGTRATMPILSNVLMEANGEELSLTTTNLDIGIRCKIKVEVSQVGSITLPVRKLASIAKALPAQDVFLETTEHQAKISCGNSQFRIMGLPAAEFPALPQFNNAKTFSLKQADFARMLKSVSYAQSTDENRYVLNSVYLNFQETGKLAVVATDGRRLAFIEKDLENSTEAGSAIILPARTAAELERLLPQGDNVRLVAGERQVAFDVQVGENTHGLVESIYLVSKIIEGNFPNYRQVIPKETAHRVKLEREFFLECIQRAALVVSEKSQAVKMKVSRNLLELTAFSPEYGESHENIAISYEGPEVQLSFNPQFLLDPLRALAQDEVYFEFKDELSPGIVKTLENFLCVVMPLRV